MSNYIHAHLRPSRVLLASCVTLLAQGCASLPTRAMDIDDAIRSSVCEAVIGADSTGATLDEMSIELGVALAASVEAGLEAGIVSVSAEGSYESSSTITVTIGSEHLPTAAACRELLADDPPTIYEVSRSGEATAAPMSAAAPSGPDPDALCASGTARGWSSYATREGVSEACERTQMPTNREVRRRRVVDGKVRWQVVVAGPDGPECECDPNPAP